VNTTPHPDRVLSRPTIVHHLVLVSLLAITVINYIQRNAINPAATTLEEDATLGLTESEVGFILGAFFLSYTIMQVPSGMVARALGAKWALILFAAGWSLALGGCALATNFLGLYLGRLAMGALQAGIFPCASLILQVWYPASRRGLATALLNSFMLIGGVAGALITGRLLGPLGWRVLFGLFMIPGLVWALWFAWWFHNRPEDHPGVNPAELNVIADREPAAGPPGELDTAPRPGTPPSEKVLARHDSLVERPERPTLLVRAYPAIRVSRRGLLWLAVLALTLVCTQQAFRAGANRLVDTWMPTYYEKERNTSKEMGAYLSAFLQALGVVGGIAGGLLSDEVLRRTRSRRAARNGVALFSLLGSVALYVLAYPIGNVYLASVVFGLGVFLFCFSSPCAYALTLDIGGRYLAVIFGLMNMAGNLGAFAFVSFVPWLREVGGWNLVLLVFVGMHLAAALCWLLLDPNATIDEALATPRTE
jgi:ACS family glucarate transporter-like MFS transporter